MVVAMCRAAGDIKVVAPLRSAAKAVVEQFAAECGNLVIVNPLSYLEFGYLTANAMGIVTDSGNVAEEATFNSVPCITLNSYTEHIETVKCGSNVLVGENAENWLKPLPTWLAEIGRNARCPTAGMVARQSVLCRFF